MPEDIEKKIAGDVSETSSCDASVEGKLLEIQNEVYGISGKFVTLGQKDILKPVSLATPGGCLYLKSRLLVLLSLLP